MNACFVFICAHARSTVLETRLAASAERLRDAGSRTVGAASRVVYYEFSDDPEAAMRRLRQIRAMPRPAKESLIATMNPRWDDLPALW